MKKDRTRVSEPDPAKWNPDELDHMVYKVEPGEMERLLENPHTTVRHALALLRNVKTPGEIVEMIANDKRWLKEYRVKVAAAQHPHVSKIMAMRLVRFLFWEDLKKVAENMRVHPQVRRIAEELLSEHIQTMNLGEKIALAKGAGRPIIKVLRKENHDKIIRVLLDNFRLTEEDVHFMASYHQTPGSTLKLIARHRKWSNRYQVKFALVKNPNTPPAVSLDLLVSLSRMDLKTVVSHPQVSRVVKEAAKKLVANPQDLMRLKRRMRR